MTTGVTEGPRGGGIRSGRIGLRLTIFLLLAAFICCGPAYRHVMGRKSHYFRHWTMFHGFGSRICDVRYVQHRSNGEIAAVDRFALLDDAPPREDPQQIWKINTLARAEEIAGQLCERLAVPAAERDLRLIARCGSKQGWNAVSDGSRNLCAAQLPAATSAPR